jgi:plasmid maintenance system antidote protein VapI
MASNFGRMALTIATKTMIFGFAAEDTEPYPERMSDQARANERALSEQLQAEIRASRYRSIRQLAEAMGEDYTTLYRWVSNKRPIRMDTLFRILAMLELDPGEFFTDVRRRAERGTTTD